MVRNRQLKTSKGLFLEDDMKAAVEMVMNGNSLRLAAELKYVSYVTLSRYVKKRKEYGEGGEENMKYAPNYTVRMVFTLQQEEKLKNYLIMCSKMFYILPVEDCRPVAYEMVNEMLCPISWGEKKIAGIDWTTTQGALGLATSSGWMTSELFVGVIKHFIRHTCSSGKNPTLLIYDHVESHLSLEALMLCKENGASVLTLPPHSSNKMQPYMLRFSGRLKRIIKQLLSSLDKTASIYNTASFVNTAHQKSMTPSKIIAGFKKSGIHPFDRDVFTEPDFLYNYVPDRSTPTVVDDQPPKTNGYAVPSDLLNGFLPQVKEGAASLEEGAASLEEGAASLEEGAASLEEGAASLEEGAAAIHTVIGVLDPGYI
ncbi:hypothetical protein JTB14_003346 [Gonioctena quinquepunctata]|nr:hypothetical protein JTB14_003346 [Gonioctena quinquepunctata]